MFTIKHIDANGVERLWIASNPSYSNGTFTSESNGETLWANGGGTVYVMNEKGSTVATYRLVDRQLGQEMSEAMKAQLHAQNAAWDSRMQQGQNQAFSAGLFQSATRQKSDS